MFYKNCLNEVGLYDQKLKLWEDWDLRIRMSEKFRYNYCSKINSGYRQLKDGLNNSNHSLHFSEQIKVINKNKKIIKKYNRLEYEEILNRMFSKIKINFQELIIDKIDNKNWLKVIINSFLLFKTFQMKKTLSLIINIIIKN